MKGKKRSNAAIAIRKITSMNIQMGEYRIHVTICYIAFNPFSIQSLLSAEHNVTSRHMCSEKHTNKRDYAFAVHLVQINKINNETHISCIHAAEVQSFATTSVSQAGGVYFCFCDISHRGIELKMCNTNSLRTD